MLKKLRRKVYRKIRFQTWYRKAYYYHRKRRDLDKTIAQYRGVDVLSNKKRLYHLRRDMIRSLFRYGSYYNEYFLFGYEGKDAAYRDGFITEGVRMSYYPRMNDPKNTNLLENKYLTYQKFRDFYGRDVLRIKKARSRRPPRSRRCAISRRRTRITSSSPFTPPSARAYIRSPSATTPISRLRTPPTARTAPS